MAIILVIHYYKQLVGHKNEAKMAKLELDRTWGLLFISVVFLEFESSLFSFSQTSCCHTR